ncbi:2-oxo acid dehydrogenase subunit E2 [Mycoplasmopsis synoviae]|uniref:2-oxo acid dehydrogenase subunit E2 n=1 Tax=Mycoplasmopsis synoviae TaxID=2109 RepID=UPI000CA2F2E0|nr:2-oxo acid dehydrogenase subunit E2 [Mycoplasmopsis synoviae]AKJ20493.1 Dihydrolipoamide acetyltransferase component of pyruvate dehydrogenase complex [Mycoplasmopsis synoviae]AQU47807.1 Dihydrolipoamide acetyltransferase component of pyruvate dehydrogenase complex [Mycoplasmopsis synoviae]AWL84072.1 dihydrolipoamide acetyltransferase [Mycoplasmopsis synoviae]QLE13794.1 dihydrolipoamide acetyltransferase [Mycoplasmopsis synoviae]UZF64569.1 2-oxo acid dehydrogenase subunit E2 [Mycoplasmopsis
MQVKSTPIARALAAKLGVDISQVKGSGFDGKVLYEDVKNFSPAAAAAQPVAASASATAAPQVGAYSEAVKPIRKAIAKAMTNSWSNVAYTNLVHRVNMTKLWDLRSSIKDSLLKSEDVKITFLPFILKAVSVALKEFPLFSAKYNEAKSTLDFPGVVNLGFAVDTEAGLMVPVIKNANALSVLDLAREVSRLASAARNKTIKPDDMKNAGFTVTNYGSVGSLWGVPVINYPELAILGVGAIQDEAFVEKGTLVAGKAMYLTVAADHRWIDGADVGRFASRVKQLLESPELLGVY